MKRCWIGHEWHACPVGSLGYRLPVSDRTVFLESPGHRAFVVSHRSAIRPIQAPGDAPLIAAEFGVAPRELHCSAIKKRNPAVRIGHVDRSWQRVEQIAKLPHLVKEFHRITPVLAPICVSNVRMLLESLYPSALLTLRY